MGHVSAVLRAEDFDRASRFYTDVLGLAVEQVSGPTREGRFKAGDGTIVSIYERPGMAPPQNTTLGFDVPADRLSDVMADESDGNKVAWFEDSEGNIIVLGT